MLVVLMGMAGLALDMGRLYFSFRELQAATDAAASAGASVPIQAGSQAVGVTVTVKFGFR